MIKNTFFAVVVAATALSAATSASAFNAFFAAEQTQEANDWVDLGNFNASTAGVVEIYDFHLGTQGDLLGSHAVTEGANSDVRVNLGVKPVGDVIAILKVGTEIVGMEMIRITRDN